MAVRKKITAEPEKKVLQAFTKEQILKSDKYKDKKDLVNAVLDKGNSYTTKDINKKIEEFMKGKVK